MEGPFPRSGGSTFFTNKIDNTAGYFTIYGTMLGEKPGISGSGTLATVQFQVKESGNCDFSLEEHELISSLEEPITQTVANGRFIMP